MTQDYSEFLKLADWLSGNALPRDRKAATAIYTLLADNERLRGALEEIAEEHDAGRHDSLTEPCPAHNDLHMWLIAREALGETK